MKKIARVIIELAEILHIDLGCLAPHLYGWMLGSKPIRIEDGKTK